jgi:hypothetical protein
MARWSQTYAIRPAVDGGGRVKAERRTAGIAMCGPLLPGSGLRTTDWRYCARNPARRSLCVAPTLTTVAYRSRRIAAAHR